MTPEQRNQVLLAIEGHWKLQLGYERADGSRSLHVVAPLDLRLGDRPSTTTNEYLWAFCFAESKAETHLTDRILSARILDDVFDVAEVLAAWPVGTWPLPDSWNIPREWLM